ncbi:NUDIX hydrolase domain [Trinorchestia longiramus]|nr:NUDIX hydrolase domain [Trinorchestia longiramus]
MSPAYSISLEIACFTRIVQFKSSSNPSLLLLPILKVKLKMTVKAAGLIIYRRASNAIEYLLLQAAYPPRHWTPPKGHVDPGETDLQTAIRETQEEAGLKDKEHYTVDLNFRKELHYHVKRGPKVVVYWLAELNSDIQGDPVRLSEESRDHRWLPLDDAIELQGFKEMGALLRECELYITAKQ